MGNITSKDRIHNALKGRYLDRVPVYTNCTLSGYIADQLGYSQLEILTEPEKEFKALTLSQQEFPSDMIRVPADPLLPEASEARRELKMGADAPPPKFILENKDTIQTMTARDPRESKTYKGYLEMTGRVKDLYPDYPITALAPGPWSNAAGLRGPETFIYDTADDPDFVHEVLKFTARLAESRGAALAEHGADMVIFGDPSAGCSFISPKIYREFVKPVHEQVARYMKDNYEVLVGFHICGYTDPIMEEITSLPFDWFEIDNPSSLEKMKSLAANHMTIKGNVSTEIFFNGMPDDLKKAVKDCIDIGAPGGRYILGPGCRIPWNMKPENMTAYMEAAKQYGDLEYVNGNKP